MKSTPSKRVAVLGAGIAGAACAHRLAQAGHRVHVFDKSRGAGGRLATRRLSWEDDQGRRHTTRLDHGAVAITADTPTFQGFVDQMLQAGVMAEWQPARAVGDATADDMPGPLFLPTPDMPALCRHLLANTPTRWSFAVDSLQKTPQGWLLSAGTEQHGECFDAVLLALPPAQAATLLGPHRPDWARHAAVAPMQPCWTLMGVATVPQTATAWALARPTTGPLACVLRSDSRPGRDAVSSQAHWVAHARAAWSRQHLDQAPEEVLQQLQDALTETLGEPVNWQVCTVHRWRYALPQCPTPAPTPSGWWDASQGLGVCGDFLGGAGVEGAWLSAQALCHGLLPADVGGALAPTSPAPELAA